MPYEELLCNGSSPRGLAILGDSVSGHFHIPPAWVMPDKISPELFEHLPDVLANEMDWPMMSYITGALHLVGVYCRFIHFIKKFITRV